MVSVLTLWFLAGCVGDVGKDKAVAVVEEATPAAAADAAAEPSPVAKDDALSVDTSRSSVKALGAKVTATHPIVFKDFSGSVALDGDSVASVAFDVQMATLEADSPRLTEHLKNEDFFDVPNHPTSTFRSTGIKTGAEGATHSVTGDLTIRGTTQRVTFPATLAVSESEVTANAEFTINRQDFKVVYPGRPDDLVQDNVVLTIELLAPRS